jgi:hypothetical protein
MFWAVLIVAGAVVLAAVVVWWIMVHMPGRSFLGELPAADDPLAALSKELRADVEHLAVEIGDRRVPGRAEKLAQAADFIEAQFRAAGYEVERQKFEVIAGGECCNLAAELRGATRPEEVVVIGAHYDTVAGTPGANDNGSGVAAMLALARRFAGSKPARTLRFVAFTNEEPPYFQTDQMGSRVYAKRCRERDEQIVAMLSLETIGYYSDEPGSQNYPPLVSALYPSTGNFIGVVGNLKSRALVRRVVGTFREHEQFPCEGAALPETVPGVGFSDHWSFWQEGYPAAMITDTAMFRYPHYHEATDTPKQIDFDRLARVVRGLERVVGELVEGQ